MRYTARALQAPLEFAFLPSLVRTSSLGARLTKPPKRPSCLNRKPKGPRSRTISLKPKSRTATDRHRQSAHMCAPRSGLCRGRLHLALSRSGLSELREEGFRVVGGTRGQARLVQTRSLMNPWTHVTLLCQLPLHFSLNSSWCRP